MMNKVRDFHEKHKLPALLVLLVISIILPFVVKQALILQYICTIMIYATLAGSLNVINGYGGQICPSQAGSFATGVCTCASFSKNLGIDFWIVLPIAGILATLVGLIISLPTLKLSGIYLSIVTLGVSEIIRIIAQTWTPVTGGVLGIKQTPYPNFLRLGMLKLKYYYFIFSTIGVILPLVTRRVLKSRMGRTWMAIREDQVAVRSLGVETSACKCMNFVCGVFWARIIGVAYASFVNYIESLQFTMDTEFNVLAIVVIGGQGTLLGSTLGSAIVTILTEALYFLGNWRYVIYASIIILMMWVRSQGLMGAPDSILAGGEIQKKDNGREGKKTPEVKKA